MKKELAVKLTDTLTGSRHCALDDEVLDAIGEIVNIIAGNAKQGLEEAFRLVISLPTIVQGKEHLVRWPNSQARIICIPFKIYDNDIFNLAVAIEAVKGA
jgi:chemotaxis protein CheX